MRQRASLIPLLLLLLAVGILVSCTKRQVETFHHQVLNFSITYPAGWQLNQTRVIPPPPQGTSIGTETLTVTIVPWEQPPGDPEVLREKGWVETTLVIAGTRATAFTRPETQAGDGILKRVFVPHGNHYYDIALEVHGEKNHNRALEVFDSIVQSLTWSS